MAPGSGFNRRGPRRFHYRWRTVHDRRRSSLAGLSGNPSARPAWRQPVAVLDAGIEGNRILHDATTNVRFGVNAWPASIATSWRNPISVPDHPRRHQRPGTCRIIGAGFETVTSSDIIEGMKQMIERAHEHGIKVFGATLTPFAGTAFKGYFTPEKEVEKESPERFIRHGHAFDGVIDFDQAVRDPDRPDHMAAAYDGGDHLHPGDKSILHADYLIDDRERHFKNFCGEGFCSTPRTIDERSGLSPGE